MPGVIQRYDIGLVYDRYYLACGGRATKPHQDLLHDAQIVHDTLNNREKADIYFGFTNDWVRDRVETMGVTPMRALASIVGGHVEGGEGYPIKLSKLFEVTAGEVPFLGTARQLRNRPFHDVSAGLHHGEYEHAMQLHFVSDMYKYRYLYGTTGLRTSYQALIGEMLNPAYVINTPDGDLSFWSLVMDIQGAFIKGALIKGGKGGVRNYTGEESSYRSTFGTSATLLHYGFGWGAPQGHYDGIMEHGELANRYPYIAEAVINRGMKRQAEATSRTTFPTYRRAVSDKARRRREAQDTVRRFEPSHYRPRDWELTPQAPVVSDALRANVIR